MKAHLTHELIKHKVYIDTPVSNVVFVSKQGLVPPKRLKGTGLQNEHYNESAHGISSFKKKKESNDKFCNIKKEFTMYRVTP